MDSGTTRVRPRFVFPEREFEGARVEADGREEEGMREEPPPDSAFRMLKWAIERGLDSEEPTVEIAFDAEATISLSDGESEAFWQAAIATLDT